MTTNTLTEMIDGIVLEKTVSLEAINAINALKQRAAELEQSLHAAKEREGWLHRAVTSKDEQISALNVQLTQEKRESETLKKSLDAAKAAELQGMESKAELKGFVSAMQMVFRPSAVREVVHKNVPVPVNGGQHMGFVSNHTESTATERHAE